MKYFIALLGMLVLTCNHAQETNEKLWVPVEFSVDSLDWTGNPFDVIAHVTFSHKGSKIQYTTDMFYDDENKWRYRFTGTQTGLWFYKSESDNPDFYGLRGTVNVKQNPDANGFIKTLVDSAHGMKWGWSDIETAFSPQYVMWREGRCRFARI